MSESCRACGEPIEWRTSARSGRRYKVNAPTSTLPVGQFHSMYCGKAKQLASQPPEPPAPQQSHSSEPIAEHGPTAQRDSLATLIAQHVAAIIPAREPAIDESRVREIVRKAMSENGHCNITVSVCNSNSAPIDVGRQHKQFPLLLSIIARRRNLWIAGPAGSGKTSAAHAAARALNLEFGSMSVGPQTTQSSIFGYMDAHGNYVPTEFRRRYEQGGVFLFDEIDRGNPGVLTALNQAIENGACAFPDAMIPKHTDFVSIAAANTFGMGASREYVGALQLDAATRDRFVMLAWDYDESLERDLAYATFEASGGTDQSMLADWIALVRSVRAKANKLQVRHVVSPRASIIGADLLASGIPAATVADCVLWKGLDTETIERLR